MAPINYSKWDALELSDDSDIEVHPNVDKRSFIRAKQNQIHMERQQRRHQIETLKYEREINKGLMGRISALLAALKAHADEAAQNPGEVAFRAVMESSAGLKPEDDVPPPRPEGVHANVEQPPSYSRMMATLLDQVNKALDEKKVGTQGEERYKAMVAEIEDHLAQVQKLQTDLQAKLDELQREEGKKITSEDIHTGFDSSFVNKSKPSSEAKTKEEGKVELLNPNFDASSASSSSQPPKKVAAAATDEDEMEASPDGKRFGAIKMNEYRESMNFLSQHPAILTEKEQDGLMVMGFDAALQGDDELARQYIHQALLLQYCRALGRDGVGLFFKRITTEGHQARGVFLKDVQDTYARIRTRAREIMAQRAKDEAEGKTPEGDEVEQIQLHAVEPGTVISISIPPADSQDTDQRKAREIFDSFTPDMRKALETGNLDEVNKALGRMKVDDAEDVVNKLGEAGILSLEEGVIDATTEEGKAQLKQMENQAAATTSEEVYGDQE